VAYPKIELHVHLEGTVRPATLFELAHANGYALPCDTPQELVALYEFRDFAHFIEVWMLVTAALRRADDFRRILVDYAEEAVGHGAVYVEAIFAPMLRRGVDCEALFSGYCDGVVEARERFGLEVRLTPDIPRGYTAEEAETTVRYAARYRDRGIVGIGLGGLEADYPPEQYEPAFRLAADLGLPAVPHAGEHAGPASVRGALDALGAVRIRHGIRATDDPGLVRELAGRGTVLDVCPISNLRTRAVASLEEHPLPRLVAAGVRCSLATDDPAMFGTDLTREHEVATGTLGLDPRAFYDAGVAGALCDDGTKDQLKTIGERFDWPRFDAAHATLVS
jgi:aminodeoxyfutalosine deaminase